MKTVMMILLAPGTLDAVVLEKVMNVLAMMDSKVIRSIHAMILMNAGKICIAVARMLNVAILLAVITVPA